MKPNSILLIEINEGEIPPATTVINDAKIRNAITGKTTNWEALLLKKKRPSKNKSFQDLFFSCNNLPEFNSRTVPYQIRYRTQPKSILNIMIATSSFEIDSIKGYKQCVSYYIPKPVYTQNHSKTTVSTSKFQFSIVKLLKNN
ncbi:hypothetical protein [Flavobacterium sp. '19STA2R22 D10 B1']|uniref:hypothetical protein n=1 Tax=Flavobacterium aerium TaxID=3037261 RepID=UPI00278BDA67|nr:hypothetical protein [Flavobacterium sp. '19STA2R22 D10 B1']